MDIPAADFLAEGKPEYCYHLEPQPSDIIACYQGDQLIIQDVNKMPATKSPSLQLVCIAREHHVPLELILNHWQNAFVADNDHILRFIKVIRFCP